MVVVIDITVGMVYFNKISDFSMIIIIKVWLKESKTITLKLAFSKLMVNFKFKFMEQEINMIFIIIEDDFAIIFIVFIKSLSITMVSFIVRVKK